MSEHKTLFYTELRNVQLTKNEDGAAQAETDKTESHLGEPHEHALPVCSAVH